MVIVHDTDKYKYFDKQRKVKLIKYSNGVKNIYDGKAIYLPKKFMKVKTYFQIFLILLRRTKIRFPMLHQLHLQLLIA